MYNTPFAESTATSCSLETGPSGSVRSTVIPRSAGLTEWELGVLASYTVETHWEQFTVALRVPEPVAARLLPRNGSALPCIAQDAAVAATPELPPEEEQPLGPGVFDDTPVSDWRPVTAAHLPALCLASRDPDQLYLVFSMTAGPEVIALTVLERRCAAGWEGVIIAGADDLPGTLVEARRDAGSADGAPDGEGVWLPRVHNSRNPDFGRSLSTGEGERLLVRLCKGRWGAPAPVGVRPSSLSLRGPRSPHPVSRPCG
ncbi:hypothetical protein ACFV3E_41310 [Streptomyces sp. NPDC059718]